MKIWEALAQSKVRSIRVPEKVPEKVPKKVPKKVPEKVPEKVPGGCGAEPGYIQWFGKKSWRRFREALVQSQIRFNKVLENNPEKVWEALV